MTRPTIYTVFLIATLLFGSCSTVKEVAYVPSNLESIAAIKEVLNSSAFRALSTLSKASEGGIEALLPDQVKPVVATLRTLGLSKEIDQLNVQLGSASKVAHSEGTGIMTDAISELKFGDATSIILGGEHAATIVLKEAMYSAVTKRYSQRLALELDKVDETKHWDTAVSTYNLFAKNKIQGTLAEFLAKRAVDAVFIAVGKEEAVIRNNPSSLNSEVVTRVFDYYKDRN